jgi:hypothetical protein
VNTPRRVPGRLRPRTSPPLDPSPVDPSPVVPPPVRADRPESTEPVDPVVAETAPESDTRDTAPILYTADQAATMLQVRPSWLRRRAAARAVPCRFLGKHLRFARQDIEEIAAAARHAARTPVDTVTRYGNPSRRA